MLFRSSGTTKAVRVTRQVTPIQYLFEDGDESRPDQCCDEETVLAEDLEDAAVRIESVRFTSTAGTALGG